MCWRFSFIRLKNGWSIFLPLFMLSAPLIWYGPIHEDDDGNSLFVSTQLLCSLTHAVTSHSLYTARSIYYCFQKPWRLQLQCLLKNKTFDIWFGLVPEAKVILLSGCVKPQPPVAQCNWEQGACLVKNHLLRYFWSHAKIGPILHILFDIEKLKNDFLNKTTVSN